MRRSVVAALGLLVVTAAGCGGGGDEETDVAGEGDTTTTTTTAGDDEVVTVGLADSDLGSILVDGERRTLYLFTNDEPGVSTCAGDCAENWPPLEAPEPLVAGEGVDEDLLESITRDDGTDQVTYAGKPLYHFAADAGPGDTKGQGVGDVWFVLGADGEPITAAAAPDPGVDYGAAPAAGDSDPAPAAEAPSATIGGGSSAARETTASTSPAAAPTTTTTAAAPAPTAAIRIANFTYSPLALQISRGTVVTATNADPAPHTWTADNGSWDSGTLAQGDRYEHTFNDRGTFSYFCAIHPSMKGTVTVS